MKDSTKNLVYVAIIGLAVIVVSWSLFFSGEEAPPPQRPPEELRAIVEKAVQQPVASTSSNSSGSVDEYRPASSSNTPTETIVRDERLDAIGQLGEIRDQKSVPILLDAMEDPSPEIRGKAAAAVAKIMKADFYFRANDPPERREEILRLIRSEWERFRNAGFK